MHKNIHALRTEIYASKRTGHNALKGVKEFAPWPYRNTPLTYQCCSAKFGRSRSNGWCIIRSSRKLGSFASRPLRSLEVIGTSTDRSATCDFHSKHGPKSYRFRDKGRYLQKICPHLGTFNAPLRVFLDFYNSGGARKTRMMPLPDLKKCDDASHFLDTVPALDGQTDR